MNCMTKGIVCRCEECREELILDRSEEKELLKKGEIYIKCPCCNRAIVINIKKQKGIFGQVFEGAMGFYLAKNLFDWKK